MPLLTTETVWNTVLSTKFIFINQRVAVSCVHSSHSTIFSFYIYISGSVFKWDLGFIWLYLPDLALLIVGQSLDSMQALTEALLALVPTTDPLPEHNQSHQASSSATSKTNDKTKGMDELGEKPSNTQQNKSKSELDYQNLCPDMLCEDFFRFIFQSSL